jgi:hypothetical protein
MSRLFFNSVLTVALVLLKSEIAVAQTSSNWKLNSEDLQSVFEAAATASAREDQKKENLSLLRPDRFDLNSNPINDLSANFWKQALWAVALEEPKDPQIESALTKILGLSDSLHQEKILKRAFQTTSELYLAQSGVSPSLKDSFLQIIKNGHNPQWVAMSLEALVSKEPNSPDVTNWVDIVRTRFSTTNNLLLETTLRDIASQINSPNLPPLKDLLTWQIAPNQSQLYVFCRPDRNILCTAVLKDRQARFIYDGGSLWSVPLLTRSIHQLRSQFEHGQSPAGIYRIEGTMPRPENSYFRAFGQFPLVKLFLPFEDGANRPLPRKLEAYQSLFPNSWRGYFPMEQTYWAGKIGRGLIRIHGTGEAENFFASSGRFPASYGWNPAIGCLSALEVYDKSGRLEKADMPKILQAISQASSGIVEGYMILVEIPSDSNKPVTTDEILSLIQTPNQLPVEENIQTIKVEPPP